MRYHLGFMDRPAWSEGIPGRLTIFFDVDEDGHFEPSSGFEVDQEGLGVMFPSGGWLPVQPE